MLAQLEASSLPDARWEDKAVVEGWSLAGASHVVDADQSCQGVDALAW
jgi:hypothetical protein